MVCLYVKDLAALMRRKGSRVQISTSLRNAYGRDATDFVTCVPADRRFKTSILRNNQESRDAIPHSSVVRALRVAPSALLGAVALPVLAFRQSVAAGAAAAADGEDVIHFRGNVSVDGRNHGDAYTPETEDTRLIRRPRPTSFPEGLIMLALSVLAWMVFVSAARIVLWLVH
jgi:hypothetical protein